MTYFSNDSNGIYLILTHQLPMRTYNITEGYSLRAIRPTQEIVDEGPCNVHTQRMALPFIDVSSHNVYRDLVMFHSFITNEPETYRYAEYLEQISSRFFMESELDYIDDLASSEAEHPYGGLCRDLSTDFERFPTLIFSDPQDIITGTKKEKAALAIPEEWTNLGDGIYIRKDDQSVYEDINYAVAFGLYRKLRSIDKNLRNAIDLYVFTRTLWDMARIYRNDYMSAALYIAILESVTNEPSWCKNKVICDTCGEEIPHRIKSLEKHFSDEYGIGLKKLRGIRHDFVHNIAHFDIPDTMYEVYDKWYIDKKPILEVDKKKENKVWEILQEIEKIERVTRKRMLELFLGHYYKEVAANS